MDDQLQMNLILNSASCCHPANIRAGMKPRAQGIEVKNDLGFQFGGSITGDNKNLAMEQVLSRDLSF